MSNALCLTVQSLSFQHTFKLKNMKNTISIILLFLSFGLMAQGQTATNFVVLTPKIEQLQPILLTAQEIKADGNFEVVLYGNEVGKLTSPETDKFIQWAEKMDVKISVCRMSLDRLKINPNSLPKEIKIVDNAFLHSFQLQKKGYKNLSL